VASPTFTSYVIQAGETLGAIARSCGVTLQDIRAANPDITDSRRVKANQTILIPPPEWAPNSGPSLSPNSSPSSSYP
jgi:LysM repeat protein